MGVWEGVLGVVGLVWYGTAGCIYARAERERNWIEKDTLQKIFNMLHLIMLPGFLPLA